MEIYQYMCKCAHVWEFHISSISGHIVTCKFLSSFKNTQWSIFLVSAHSTTSPVSTDVGSSASKVSACNARDPGPSPVSGSFLGEGMGCPLQSSWASLVAQMVKNLPTMQETWVHSLGLEDPLEEGMTIHSSTLGWKIPMGRRVWRATVYGVAKSWTQLGNKAQSTACACVCIDLSFNVLLLTALRELNINSNTTLY